ncbi:DUF3857 domain-containing protein [Gracilimonas sp.]|uniref:DUF3857 domain-containing protein n=1 Tax=Gracilimonas sp. TaxID=1974203 RepID=UPI0032EF376B
MMNKLALISLVLIFSGCGGQKILFEPNPEYIKPVSDIYTLGASSSVRDQEVVLSFYSEDEAEYTEHGVITILDEEHRHMGNFQLFYDHFRELEYLDVQVTNKSGMVVGVYTIDDAQDFSASGSNFFTDARVKVLEAYYYSYPYTIEYKYKYKYSGTLNLPSWRPKSYSQSLNEASFEIKDYTKGNVRYFSKNIEGDPTVTELADYRSTKWELNTELAKKREVYSPPYSEIFPNVVVSASNFKVENSKGDASSWESFGKWYYHLAAGKRELPASAREEIDRLLAGIESERDKVITLYKYMQDQVRYVSIQLGLGGWEPFSADFVYKNKYGDCKALVNYMHAILEYAGIKAQPALIRNGIGSPEVIAEFPSNQFNHVILRVTLQSGEVIWLECTSKYIKPGRIGAGNEGKNALLVTSEGGKIMNTGISDAEQNVVSRFVEVKLSEDGSASLLSKLHNKGAMDDDMVHQLRPLSEKKREEWLIKSITLNDFSLESYKFLGLSDEEPETGYQANINASDFASASSKRLFVPVNKLNRWNIYIPDEEFRSTALRLPYKFSEIDTTIFELPGGYTVEALPADELVENNFGSFRFSLTKEEGKILMERELIIQERDISREEYEEFKSFFATVAKVDQAQFVIVKE